MRDRRDDHLTWYGRILIGLALLSGVVSMVGHGLISFGVIR
ncbi:hypothetical protein [Mesorhizobium sp. J428]|nr:hypothetical protein [Mesorhizobium sp. J428]